MSQPADTIAVIDGDEWAFKACSAAEGRAIIAKHIPSGREKEFNHRTEFLDFLKAQHGGKFTEDQFEIRDVQYPEPIENVLFTLKQMIAGVCAEVNATGYQVLISGPDNFRLDIDLPKRYRTPPNKRAPNGTEKAGRYKESRGDSLRPVHLSDAKKYLIKKHGALTTYRCEADDALATRGYAGRIAELKGAAQWIIPCTQDKDAMGVESRLYNPNKPGLGIMDNRGFGQLVEMGKDIKGHGRMWLYFQILLGDSTDNYNPRDILEWATYQAGGTPKPFGEKKVYSILKDCQDDRDAWKAMYDQYKLWYPEEVEYVSWTDEVMRKDAIDIMQMYVDCAHMQRWENDRINVRQTLEKMGVIECSK
ncbi:hypothetical protein [Pseudomonas aeruginosa]|uniref:hypothetical protein n=1 Tax=Pseudomonas aeruginosa TaxID=287 RepID=UPI001CBE53FF|nr:hypothetical protein [Pseudomonas aeruginosa]